jgi:hypothetical protein
VIAARRVLEAKAESLGYLEATTDNCFYAMGHLSDDETVEKMMWHPD